MTKATDTPVIDPGNHRELLDRIKRGEVFVFPTDTVYGLGASIRHEGAVREVFELKNRSPDRTVPVLTTAKKARELAGFSTEEERAAEVHWPGSLTLVLEATVPEEHPPGIVRDGTIALRAPGREALRELLAAGPPIVGTSANRTGEEPARTRDELDASLLEEVDFLIDGDPGQGESSTVAEWDDEEWKIHREGPVEVGE